MSCLSTSIPCKYFAAGGCWKNRECKERVGDAGDWVEKTHEPTDGQTWEKHWLDSDPIRKDPVSAEKRDGFRWAIVVDVEGKDIIELPAIVIDLESGCEVWRFHRWVSIRKVMKYRNFDSNAVALQEALQEFFTGLSCIPSFDQKDALMVHCGDFDAGMLKKAWVECAQDPKFCPRPTQLPDLLMKWCNLKDLVFNAVNKDAEFNYADVDGMNKVASFLGVPREGANLEYHHLGMYDTEFIARILLFALQQEDHPLVFQPTSEWKKANDQLLPKALMSTNKRVGLKCPQLQQFLIKSNGKFQIEDFDNGSQNMLSTLDEAQKSSALADLLDKMNTYDPRSKGIKMKGWVGALLKRWILSNPKNYSVQRP